MKKQRSKLKVLFCVAFIAALMCAPSVSAHDINPFAVQPRIYCNCGGLCRVRCDESYSYDYSATHKYNFTKTCTRNYYNATYLGYQCEYCGTIRPLFDNFDGVHLCFVEHEDCGITNDVWCRDGEVT